MKDNPEALGIYKLNHLLTVKFTMTKSKRLRKETLHLIKEVLQLDITNAINDDDNDDINNRINEANLNNNDTSDNELSNRIQDCTQNNNNDVEDETNANDSDEYLQDNRKRYCQPTTLNINLPIHSIAPPSNRPLRTSK